MLQQISFKMAGYKKKNVYRKKRKRKPFSGVQKQAKRQKKTTEIVDPTPSTSRDCSDTAESELENMEEPISASRKKMKLQSSLNDSSGSFESENDMFQGQGYRLIDLERLSSTLSEAHVCEEGETFLLFFNFFSCTRIVSCKPLHMLFERVYV